MTSLSRSSQHYRPILYVFQLGDDIFRYTDNDENITSQNEIYESFSGEVISTGSLESAEKPFLLRVASNSPIAHILLNAVDFETVKFHASFSSNSHSYNPNEEKIWSGSISRITMDGEICLLEGQSFLNQWREEVYPALRLQIQCAHMLYDKNCTVNEDNVRIATTITSLVGTTLKLKDIRHLGDGWFDSGVIKHEKGEQRTIVQHQGDTLTLAFPFRKVYQGDSVSLLPGCDRTSFTCRKKYNNLRHYGGFLTIPLINPFYNGLR